MRRIGRWTSAFIARTDVATSAVYYARAVSVGLHIGAQVAVPPGDRGAANAVTLLARRSSRNTA